MPELPEPGKVYLVGAGPGDPRLMTLRGAELLQHAQVVIYDYLVNPQILHQANDRAILIALGGHKEGRRFEQERAIEWMIDYARTGKDVVRLKGGDPAIFGRLNVETAALRHAGIDYEIVPGSSAGSAAAAYAEISLTDRDASSAVAFITGQESDEKQFSKLDFKSLASFPGTLVIYMGTTTVERWSRELIDSGKPGSTPIAIVRHASRSQQSVVRCTLETVARTVSGPPRMRPPAVFIIGEVVEMAPAPSWFEKLPLFGKTILIARPAGQTAEAESKLVALGARVLLQPAIQISATKDSSSLDAGIQSLPEYDWVVFSSVNGVDYFQARLQALGFDSRRFAKTKIAAIGPATAQRLTAFGLRSDLIPPDYRAESLAAELIPLAQQKKVLLVRANRGRDYLLQELEKRVATVAVAIAYENSDVLTPDGPIQDAMSNGEIDFCFVTSSTIARSLHRMFGEALRNTKLVSISPVTTATLSELGLVPAIEATQFDLNGMIARMVQFIRP